MPEMRKGQAVVTTYYISGPMTGMPERNFPLFDSVAEELRDWGHGVINPASNFKGTEVSWEDYMRLSLEQLTCATHVIFLPGWQNSRGARLEYATARVLGLQLRTYGPATLDEPVEAVASDLVRSGERQAIYGHPAEDFARTAQLWTGILGTEIDSRQVALCMAAVKISRLVSTPEHRDSIVDLIGYAVCFDRLGEV